MGYDFFLRAVAIESLKRIRGRDRAAIRQFLDELAGDPYLAPDAYFEDMKHRELGKNLVGRHVIVWHVDHAMQEIRIMRILPVDS